MIKDIFVMKQTAKIILLISGIIDMALLFTVWIPLDVMTVLSSGGIYLFFLPLVIILRLILFLTGLFSIIAGIKLSKGLCVTTLIFSILSLDVMSLCGAIIGLSALKNRGHHVEVISPDGKRSVVIINDDSQNEVEKVEERPLTGAGKGLKIAGKIALAFNAIGALFTMLVQVLMFTLGPVVMIGGIVYFVFEVIDVMLSAASTNLFQSATNNWPNSAGS